MTTNTFSKTSRRDFLRNTATASLGIAATSAVSACSPDGNSSRDLPFQPFSGEDYRTEDGVAGLLFSQVGYELGWPVRIMVRLPRKELLSTDTRCRLIPVDVRKQYETSVEYWGDLWGSHWWTANFNDISEPGEWNIAIIDQGTTVFRDSGLIVDRNILWDSTMEWSSVDMLERRKHFTKVGAGWQDAGTLWVESPAQSAMIIALTELLEKCPERFEKDFNKRIYDQIIVGCDYLVMTQEKATALGFPKGSMSHDLLGHEKDILPHDAMKATIALAKAGRLLPWEYQEKKTRYQRAAQLAYKWLIDEAKPMGDYGYVKMQRGLSADALIPNDEWPTRDLVSMLWASTEMLKAGNQDAGDQAIRHANKIITRQITAQNAEHGFYGNFREFDSLKHAEPSWVHGIVPSDQGAQFGTDMGGIYPNYLLPFIDILKMWSDHADAPKWKETLRSFVYNFLIPACEKNPFHLVPQGIFEKEGPIWFCGTFHGTNAIYGYTAALALELNQIFDEPKLKEIAYGNLQWLAGLNAGITSENVKEGCVIFSADIPAGQALPASMICHIGNRWAGTWFQTRGVICNGFSTGKQFVYDVVPLKKNDGPFSLTDEDWIPHSAAWLSGLIRLV